VSVIPILILLETWEMKKEYLMNTSAEPDFQLENSNRYFSLFPNDSNMTQKKTILKFEQFAKLNSRENFHFDQFKINSREM